MDPARIGVQRPLRSPHAYSLQLDIAAQVPREVPAAGAAKNLANQEGQHGPTPYDRYTQVAGRWRRWFFDAALLQDAAADNILT
jgi:hypothetical protein